MSATGRTERSRVYPLVTLRSNSQFNTTIYDYTDRLRGLDSDRLIVMMSPDEIAAAGLRDGDAVTLVSAHEDGRDRRLPGLRLVAYDLPQGCVAAYYPEANVLVPLDLHDQESKTPAYKSAPLRIERDG